MLPEAECRYGVYDFSYVGKEGVEKNKLFFVSWVPDVAKVKAKMLYASSKERFRRELDGARGSGGAEATRRNADAGARCAAAERRIARARSRGRAGIQLEIQATDASEIDESVLRDKCTQVGQ
jgi:hypothetical protein